VLPNKSLKTPVSGAVYIDTQHDLVSSASAPANALLSARHGTAHWRGRRSLATTWRSAKQSTVMASGSSGRSPTVVPLCCLLWASQLSHLGECRAASPVMPKLVGQFIDLLQTSGHARRGIELRASRGLGIGVEDVASELPESTVGSPITQGQALDQSGFAFGSEETLRLPLPRCPGCQRALPRCSEQAKTLNDATGCRPPPRLSGCEVWPLAEGECSVGLRSSDR
jgi:hypothetical protein